MSDYILCAIRSFIMDNGKEIPVSWLRSKEFSGVILQYMKNM